MTAAISPRLAAIVDALPLQPGMRVLEIGCGPGAAARAVADRVEWGYVLGIDRSAKAIAQAVAGSGEQISLGRLAFRKVAVEAFALEDGEAPYDIAFAVRVGALDGRQPEIGGAALRCIARSSREGGRLFIDGGDPLKEILLRGLSAHFGL